jgi:hypothetical protein
MENRSIPVMATPASNTKQHGLRHQSPVPVRFRALDAFNVGWGLLHEFDHIVNDSPDAISLGETGECEAHINQMRRECGLPERVDYFYTLLALSGDTAFATRLVRLAFDQELPSGNKRKRYWVLWDANVVGGLDVQKQIASLR